MAGKGNRRCPAAGRPGGLGPSWATSIPAPNETASAGRLAEGLELYEKENDTKADDHYKELKTQAQAPDGKLVISR